jgi:hypothetical protein
LLKRRPVPAPLLKHIIGYEQLDFTIWDINTDRVAFLYQTYRSAGCRLG